LSSGRRKGIFERGGKTLRPHNRIVCITEGQKLFQQRREGEYGTIRSLLAPLVVCKKEWGDLRGFLGGRKGDPESPLN